VLATASTAGHARFTVTAVALLRSFVADGNGEGRLGVRRLVETGGAKGFHSNGWQHKQRLSMLFAFEGDWHGISERGRQCGREEDLFANIIKIACIYPKNGDLSLDIYQRCPVRLGYRTTKFMSCNKQ
jgi:hypothetical protein